MKSLLIILTLLAAPVSAETWKVPLYMRGGGVTNAFLGRIDRLNAAGMTVQIPPGLCSSACTLFLIADNVCISPKTTFEFHGPSSWGAVIFTAITMLPSPGHMMTKENYDNTVSMLTDEYNRLPGLGDWFKVRASKKFGYFVVPVKGAEINRVFNVRICDIYK